MRSLIFLLLTTTTFAQGTKADYERAATLAKRTDGNVLLRSVKPEWQKDGDSFWYKVETADSGWEFVFVDCAKGTRAPAFDHMKVAAALFEQTRKQPDAAKLPLERLQINVAEQWVRFRFEGKRWQFANDTGSLRAVLDDVAPEQIAAELKPRPSRAEAGGDTNITFINKSGGEAVLWWISAENERKKYATVKPGESHKQHTFAGHVWFVKSPGGVALGVFEGREDDSDAIIAEPKDAPRKKEEGGRTKAEWRAFVRDFDLWVKHRDSGEEVRLSHDGKKEDPYLERVQWSPDGKLLVATQERPAQEHTVYFVESSPKDQVQPKLHQHNYLKPGDRIAEPKLRLFDVAARKQIEVKNDFFPKPWSFGELRWRPDGSEFVFLYNERGHQLLRWIAVDARSGASRVLVEEKSATFVDYSQKTWFRWLEKTDELLWGSERDGWNHVYLFDAKTGALKNQITRGEWVVRGVERVDEEKRQLWLRVGGVHAGQDPYYVHFARVNFDGSDFTLLTDGDGTRGGRGSNAMVLSPNGRWLLDTYSRVDLPPVSELRSVETGKLVCVLEKADAAALAATGWAAPERFAAKGRDGKTDIFGVIIKPANFDPAKKYPVIEEIYAGPHGYFAPKEWGRQTRQRAMAELGFVVAQLDGMGTNWRSRAFHDVAWRNIKDAGFPDRIAWMRAAATTRPWMDLGRVGIYGGSAGGQNALAALLHHGDFYKAAVADCGCHDNRMDKIWWNEAWLGEVGPWYAENSNVTHAAKLTGKLLLIFGELDTNVDPASTMQVANALIKADKDFDLLVMTGSNHGAAESPYGTRRRMDFFVRHLYGVEPRAK